MSRYEVLNVWLQVFSVFIAGIGIIVAIFALYAAYTQLKKMTSAAIDSQRANEISATAALIQVEIALFDSLGRIGTISAEQLRLEARDDQGQEAHPNEVEALQNERRNAIQNYLNILDRLCGCILQGMYPDCRARAEYRHVLATVLDDYGFIADTFDAVFPNITALRLRWGLSENKSQSER